MRKKLELKGMRFGRLTVIEEAGRANKYVLWKCRCDCGSITLVRSSALKRGEIVSCGCFAREKTVERNTKHGDGSRRLYKIWYGMKYRCTSKKSFSYKNYGGKGITVCDEWKVYEAFKRWALDNGYSDNLTLERKENDKGYSPSNCRWATKKEQARNTNRNILFDGKPLAEICEAYGVKYHRVYNRLHKGWDLQSALSLEKWYSLKGKPLTVRCREAGLDYSCVNNIMRRKCVGKEEAIRIAMERKRKNVKGNTQ